ncbi:gluconate 2-dehydrogenase subunit 3 family protein [Maribacter sp. 2307ULW6-5]|uniref:gluconate 2-dehydrogenase subunit 3 family protein n=1 Tax=Maribacter sp. 2307ULW6-5 TaxID=3386275 RepID=UPI0039BD76F9
MDRRKALKHTGLWVGAAVATPTLLSLLQSCKNEARPAWQPEFFSDHEAMTIGALVDTILPRTDTPGALDVKVDVFLDKVFSRTYDAEGQNQIRQEIAAFNEEAQENFGGPFAQLTNGDQAKMLVTAEKKSATFNPGIWGKTVGDQEPVGFYRSIKAMAIWAYMTSEEIGENVLSYDPMPGNYEGCKPVSEVGNKWSL